MNHKFGKYEYINTRHHIATYYLHEASYIYQLCTLYIIADKSDRSKYCRMLLHSGKLEPQISAASMWLLHEDISVEHKGQNSYEQVHQ